MSQAIPEILELTGHAYPAIGESLLQLRGELRRVGKAVYMQFLLSRQLLAQYPPDVFVCFACMYCYRLAQSYGLLQLPNEDLLLYFARRIIVVVVQPNLAPADTKRLYRISLVVSTPSRPGSHAP